MMKRMPFIACLLLFCCFQSSNLWAQGHSGMDMPLPKMPTSDELIASTGLFSIDPSALFKKCKVKDEAKLSQMKKVLIAYQQDFSRLSFEKNPQIDSVVTLSNLKGITSQGEMIVRMDQLQGVLLRLKNATLPMQQKLKEGMHDILNEKEKKRFDSFYRTLCDENRYLNDKRPKAKQGQRPPRMQHSPMRGGMGPGYRGMGRGY